MNQRAAHQKGFTLLELLVASAVSGIMLSGLVTAIFQTIRVTTSNSTQITALEDIKSVAHRVIADVRMAQTTYPVDGAPPVNNLVLDWTSWYDVSGQLSSVARHDEYTLLSGGKVQRYYDPDTSLAANEITATFGRYISDIKFSRQGSVVIVTITSSPEGEPETAEQETYYIGLRPMESPVQ